MYTTKTERFDSTTPSYHAKDSEHESSPSIRIERRTSLSFLPATSESPAVVEMEEEFVTNELSDSLLSELGLPFPQSFMSDSNLIKPNKANPPAINRRGSLGIALEDVFELTGDSPDSSRKRCSLDLLFQTTTGESEQQQLQVRPKTENTQQKYYFRRSSMSLVEMPPLGSTNDIDLNHDLSTDSYSCHDSDVTSVSNQNYDRSPLKRVSLSSTSASTSAEPMASLSPFSSISTFKPDLASLSPLLNTNYESKLKHLINCMDNSEISRREVSKVKIAMKKHLKTQRKKLQQSLLDQQMKLKTQENQLKKLKECSIASVKPGSSISYCAIKASRRQLRTVSSTQAYTTGEPTSLGGMPVLSMRRRSSVGVQSFKMKFFPDCA